MAFCHTFFAILFWWRDQFSFLMGAPWMAQQSMAERTTIVGMRKKFSTNDAMLLKFYQVIKVLRSFWYIQIILCRFILYFLSHFSRTDNCREPFCTNNIGHACCERLDLWYYEFKLIKSRAWKFRDVRNRLLLIFFRYLVESYCTLCWWWTLLAHHCIIKMLSRMVSFSKPRYFIVHSQRNTIISCASRSRLQSYLCHRQYSLFVYYHGLGIETATCLVHHPTTTHDTWAFSQHSEV